MTRSFLLSILTALTASACLHAAESAKIEADLVYGHKDGMALTLDIIRPAKPSGAGVLWIQSGGWYSGWNDPRALLPGCQPMLDRGYTVFIVRHGSAPRYNVTEAVEDVRRAVRFIHLRGKQFGVDPDRLGALGGSAGGHLALMLATTGDDGNPGAKDPVLQQSSRIAAAVALYPPTDLRGWVENPPEAIRKIPSLKPPLTFDPKKEPDVSPLLKVTDRTAAALMIHGDKDTLVPIDHSKKMLAALEKIKVPGKLVLVEGAGHGFSPKQNKDLVWPATLAWFDRYLADRKSR